MTALIIGEPRAVLVGHNRPSLCAVGLEIQRNATFKGAEICFNPMQLAIGCDTDRMVMAPTRGCRPIVRRGLAGNQFRVDRTASRSRLGFHPHVPLAVRCQRNRGWCRWGGRRDQAVASGRSSPARIPRRWRPLPMSRSQHTSQFFYKSIYFTLTPRRPECHETLIDTYIDLGVARRLLRCRRRRLGRGRLGTRQWRRDVVRRAWGRSVVRRSIGSGCAGRRRV